MKLCIPLTADRGLASPRSIHFGSAPMFVIHDTETSGTVFAGNEDQQHEHTHCSPLRALDGQAVDAILVGGIGGGRAVSRLAAASIAVYRVTQGSLGDTVQAWQDGGSLEQISAEEGCTHHSGCAH